jgi:hypothetical protein
MKPLLLEIVGMPVGEVQAMSTKMRRGIGNLTRVPAGALKQPVDIKKDLAQVKRWRSAT